MPSRFSIIMPAYNAEKYVKQALQSILTQLAEHDEIIFVNDGSSDNTETIVRAIADPRIIFISLKQNLGISGARNAALSHVTGDYVAFADADDLWPEHRHEVCQAIIKNSDPDIISGVVQHFYCDSLSADERKQFKLPETQEAALPGSTIFKKAMIDLAGEFDSSLKVGEFIDYVSRMKAVVPNWYKVDKQLLLRRIHGHNHTTINKGKQHDYLEVVRRHLQRKQVEEV